MTAAAAIRARRLLAIVALVAILTGALTAAGVVTRSAGRGAAAIDAATVGAGRPDGGAAMQPSDTGEDVELGPTDASTLVDFSVVLRQPDPARAKAFLAGLSDPASPDYRRFLTPEEFGRQFGPSDGAIAAVIDWLRARGFAVEGAPPQRTSLPVRGSVAAVNDAFGISMRDRRDEYGRDYRAPDRDPIVPAELRDLVSAVGALETRGPDPAAVPVLPAIPNGVLFPQDVARAYEIEALHAAGLRGEGQSIGIVSFDTFLDEDVAAFDELADTAARGGATPPAVRRVRIPNARTTPGDGSGEVNLDIDVVRSIAPMAQIINYESPNTNFGPIIREIVQRSEVDIVSISWGLCERKLRAAERAADDAEFAAAAAAGISIFVASGDHGAHDCRFWPIPRNNPRYRDLEFSVTAPGSPDVILVGGTYLSVNTDGTYREEAGWEDPLTGWATGGGVSTVYERPSWQVGIGVQNADSTGMRQVPDVAGPADGDSGFLVVWTPPGASETNYTSMGGTSAAAPFWAASMLLTRQLAEQQGVQASASSQLGTLGPLLYQLSASAPAGALFHDVVRGGNLHHNATPGWDYATGLGTPRVTPLAQAIVDSLR